MPPASVFDVIRFWRPLAGTLLLMAIEAPIATAFITRCSDSQLNLAAFGVALGLALVFEGPVLRFISATLVLVEDRHTLIAFHRFVLLNLFAITAIGGACAIDPVFSWIAGDLLGLTPELSKAVQACAWSWAAFPLFVGYRRFFHGLLLQAHKPHLIALGTSLRLLAMVVTLFVLFWTSDLSGAQLGIVSIGLGMFVEMLAAIYYSLSVVRFLLSQARATTKQALTHWEMAKFYYPLAASSIILMLAQPVQSFFVVRSRLPLESLALVPVLGGILNPFSWSAYAMNDTSLAFYKRGVDYHAVINRAAWIVALSLTALLALIAFSPLAELWFYRFNGIHEGLMELIRVPTMIIALCPAVTAWKAVNRAYLTFVKDSKVVLFAEIMELCGFALLIFLAARLGDLIGITAAAIGMLGSGIISAGLMSLYIRRRERNSAVAR